MGVPTFYRWLCNRYPLIVRELKDAVDEETCLNDLDLTEPNINGEFDCLYLDMNGIIHPCCNPSGGDKPKDEAEMFTRVCDYIDRLYAMVKPRRLIYMAIDGVAPRAKMNQQRSRRYKTALEMDYNRRAYEIAQEEFSKIGYKCPEYVEKWDSNVITPGTPFMERLTMCLHAYIRRKFETDESWRSISVIFSDSNIPGEGEHKILEFIRNQRSNEDYNPNTRHVLYGSDADLIMLGLSTHESYFYIIREAVRDFKVESPSSISILYNTWIEKINNGHLASTFADHQKNCSSDIILNGIFQNGPNFGKKLRIYSWWSDIEIVDLSMLREYLNFDFGEIRDQIGYINNHIPENLVNEYQLKKNPDFHYDFERCIDDFIFLCFFIGNDFLPNLPVFSIYKGSLDQILGIYVRVLPRIGDYLTLEGNIIPDSIIKFFRYLRDLEYEIIIQESRFSQRTSTSLTTNDRGRRVSKNINIDNSTKSTVFLDEGTQESMLSSNLVSNPPKLASFQAGGERPTISISEIESLFDDDKVFSQVESTTNITNDSDTNFNTNTNKESAIALEAQEKVREEEDSDSSIKNQRKKRRFDSMESYFQEHLSKLVKYLSEVEDYNEENILMDNCQSSNLNNSDHLENNDHNSNIDQARVLLSIDNPVSILKYRISYYNRKFNAQINFIDKEKEYNEAKSKLNEISDQVCIHYLRGLSWVLGYYYHGVPSWDWYYPYHYAPYVMDIVELLSDIKNENKIKESLIGKFNLGKPFTQFEQLMSVLPPKSGKICLPKEFYNMMIDKNNPLSEFYPSKFKQDPNGNKQRWKWVALLPFIDQKVLLETVIPLENEMDVLSKYRNKLGCDILYSFKFSPLKNILFENQQGHSNSESNSYNQFNTIKITDMPIFGYFQNYYNNPDLKILHDQKNQDLSHIEQVTVPIIETCESMQQGKEIISRMLSDDGNKRNWKSILESSFNYKINHPNYIIGYFRLEKMDKHVIWRDPTNDNFQMFKVGFGSKMLPNTRPFSNSISEFDLNNQERKYKGFKAGQSQKILFKLFNYWNLNIDFKQPSFFQANQSIHNNDNKRFMDQFNDRRYTCTSLSSHHSNYYHQQRYDTKNYHSNIFSTSPKRAYVYPPTATTASVPLSAHPYNRFDAPNRSSGNHLYDHEYFSGNKHRIFADTRSDGLGGGGGGPSTRDYRGDPGHTQHYYSNLGNNNYSNYYSNRYLPPHSLPYPSTSRGGERPQSHNIQSGMKVLTTPRPNCYDYYSRDLKSHHIPHHHSNHEEKNNL
ncbi:XRN 5'-3' exonuclease N-terminus family protein [Cryptosporidium meleagridis]|uniref:XRN 5'-3' exonuclease N-terminus family protein n=1 Tax=Cryptosporidium meleagridis TaxID=93969 RepID=A0A2P4Z4F0_9CRYT|nr:XRN 5'-3' exonuclease N-terminus family protein [Cryptosporidium meleagridis]